jgi:hypothetical protein
LVLLSRLVEEEEEEEEEKAAPAQLGMFLDQICSIDTVTAHP